MPYPNEHACRVRDPGDFSRFRRIKSGKLSIIVGRLKGKTTTTAQSYRYPVAAYTEAAARAHCKEQGGRFEAATGKKEVEKASMRERITMNFFGGRDSETQETADDMPGPLLTSMDEGEKAWQAIENALLGEKAASLTDLRASISRIVTPTTGEVLTEERPWVRDVYPDGNSGSVVIQKGRAYFRMPYTVEANGAVKLGDAEEVMPSYEPVKAQEKAIGAGAQELGEVESGFKVFRGADGEDYWLSFTSNAFKDREAETFATKTLTDYVKQVDQGIPETVKAYLDDRGLPSNDQGELWLWHIPGSKIGTPLFKAMEGRFLIEVGVFDDTPIGHAGKKELREHGADYRTSHGYLYRPDDKATGVYNWMWKFETSALPAARAANPWTGIGLIELGGKEMNEAQQKWLTERFGEDLTKQIIGFAAQKSASLEQLGFDYKEVEPEPDPKPEGDSVVRIDSKAMEVLVEAVAEKIGLPAAMKGLETALATSIGTLASKDDLATLSTRIEAIEQADKSVLTLSKGFRASQAQATVDLESKDKGDGDGPETQHIIDQKMAKWATLGGKP